MNDAKMDGTQGDAKGDAKRDPRVYDARMDSLQSVGPSRKLRQLAVARVSGYERAGGDAGEAAIREAGETIKSELVQAMLQSSTSESGQQAIRAAMERSRQTASEAAAGELPCHTPTIQLSNSAVDWDAEQLLSNSQSASPSRRSASPSTPSRSRPAASSDLAAAARGALASTRLDAGITSRIAAALSKAEHTGYEHTGYSSTGYEHTGYSSTGIGQQCRGRSALAPAALIGATQLDTGSTVAQVQQWRRAPGGC